MVGGWCDDDDDDDDTVVICWMLLPVCLYMYGAQVCVLAVSIDTKLPIIAEQQVGDVRSVCRTQGDA